MLSRHIRLFGVPTLEADGTVAPVVEAQKSLALLAYLVRRPHPVERRTLAGLLWGETTEYRSRRNLTHALGLLTARLPGCFRSDQQTVQWQPPADVWVDVSACAGLLELPAVREGADEVAPANLGPAALRLEQGVALYGGEFLAGLSLAGCADLETWLVREREHWQRRVADAYAALVAHHAHYGEARRAEALARRWLEIEPWEEQAHCAVMRLLAYRGRHFEALAQFELCQRTLATDLGVAPTEATVELADAIRRGTFRRAREPRGVGLALSLGAPVATSSGSPSAPARGPLLRPRPAIGRAAELAALDRWIRTEGCRVALITGIGGVGKTTLAAMAAEQLADHAAAVVWCSLINAPPLAETLGQCLRALGAGPAVPLPTRLETMVEALLALLADRRCLLVFDNVESLLEPGNGGPYRADCAPYGLLFTALASRAHRSCLLLTGRELPPELTESSESAGPARTVHLGGLPPHEAAALLGDYGLRGTPAEVLALAARYDGIPLAIQLIAALINELFDGEIAGFLQMNTPILGDVRALLDSQVARLSPLEQDALSWLAVERVPTPAVLLAARMAHLGSRADLLEALQRLRRRSLVELHEGALALQNVVMEHATDHLVRALGAELVEGRPDRLNRCPLLLARAEEPLRRAQARLLLAPLVDHVRGRLGPEGLRLAIGRALAALRERPPHTPGYAAANLLQLALHAGQPAAQLDLSGLCVWEADLRRAALAGLRLTGAELRGCAFTETFDRPLAIAFSPDGRTLAAGTAEGQLRLWRSDGWQLARAFHSQNSFVSALAFSPDATLLAANGPEHSVNLWRLSSGELHGRLAGHSGTVYAVAFSPDGRLLASAGHDEALRLWDVAAEREIARLSGHTGPVWGVCFSPDGRLLASAGLDRSVRVWDASDGAQRALLSEHTDKVYAVAFSPDGRLLASAGLDRSVLLWDTQTWARRATLRGHTDLIHALVFSPDGRLLASCSDDHSVLLWDVAATQPRVRLEEHRDYVRGVSFSPDGRLLASCSGDQTVRLWDVASATCRQALCGYAGMLFTLSRTPDGGLASGGVDGRIYRWSSDGSALGAPLPASGDWLRALVLSPDQATLASAGGDGRIRLWSSATGELRHTLEGHEDGIYALAYSPDGRLLASGSQDFSVRLWDARSGLCLHTLRRHTMRADAVAFSPDGRLLASGGIDGLIALWDPRSGRHYLDITGHLGWICCVTFCPATGELLSGGLDTTIRVWDPATGALRQELRGHKALINALAVSPDGRFLVSGGFDRCLLVWDRRTGAHLATLSGHTGTINALLFMPDGRTVISAGSDETVRIWDLEGLRCRSILRAEGPYAGMEITGVAGLSEAQRASLRQLGAVEEPRPRGEP